MSWLSAWRARSTSSASSSICFVSRSGSSRALTAKSEARNVPAQHVSKSLFFPHRCGHSAEPIKE